MPAVTGGGYRPWDEGEWIGNGRLGPRVKRQYLALLEAVGPVHVNEYMEEFIEWGTDRRPGPAHLEAWRIEHIDGTADPDERLVRIMRQRLRAHHEYAGWVAVQQMSKTVLALSKKAELGELEAAKQVQLQYAGMNLAYTIKETVNAFGSPKPTATQIGQLVINAGQRPKKLPGRMVQVIEAEVKELESG